MVVLKVLSYIPLSGPHPKDPGRILTAGTSTLMIAACQPGDTVTVTPGNFRSFVTDDGIAMFKVPAQSGDENPYQLEDRLGTRPMNGIARAGQMLTGVCL